MPDLIDSLPNELQASHRLYGDYNQQEHAQQKLLCELRHPRAGVYRHLRAFFDTLLVACNSGARYFAWASEHRYAQYWAPSLELAYNPQGDAFRSIHRGWPSSGQFEDYTRLAAEHYWPEGCGPRLSGGSWIVRANRDTIKGLKALVDTNRLHSVRVEAKAHDTSELFFYAHDSYTAALHDKIVAYLDAHFGPAVLPRRTPAQTAIDTAPLPLKEKRMALATVDVVTEGDRQILVPLIPIGDQSFLQNTVNDMVALLDRGWPLDHSRDWLRKQLTPASFKKLERRYGG